MKRHQALLRQVQHRPTRRNALLQRARPLTRRELLLRQIGTLPWIPTQWHNRKGRTFQVTLRGAYIIRVNGRTLYGRKATDPRAPKAIRPKRFRK